MTPTAAKAALRDETVEPTLGVPASEISRTEWKTVRVFGRGVDSAMAVMAAIAGVAPMPAWRLQAGKVPSDYGISGFSLLQLPWRWILTPAQVPLQVQSGVCDKDGVRRHRRWAAQIPTNVKLRSKLAREAQEVQLGLVQVLANTATKRADIRSLEQDRHQSCRVILCSHVDANPPSLSLTEIWKRAWSANHCGEEVTVQVRSGGEDSSPWRAGSAKRTCCPGFNVMAPGRGSGASWNSKVRTSWRNQFVPNINMNPKVNLVSSQGRIASASSVLGLCPRPLEDCQELRA